MIRLFAVAVVCAMLVSCEKESSPTIPSTPAAPAMEGPKAGELKAPATPSETAKPGIPDASGLANQAKATADTALGDVKKAAASATEGIAVPATAQELKEKVGGMNVDQLKSIADQIIGSLGKNEDTLKSLDDQIKKAGLDPAKLVDLKKSYDSSKASIDNLVSQLKIIVDKLKEGNVDVSKYTAFLTGR